MYMIERIWGDGSMAIQLGKRLLLISAISVLALPVQAQTLEEILAQSLLKNPDVAAAISARDAIVEEVEQAEGGYLPTIDVAAGIGYEWTDNTTVEDVDLTRREASINLSQMLFDGFLTRSEVERQSARKRSADERLREVAEQFVLDTSRAYLELMRRDELLKQAKETLYNHIRIYKQIRKRSESGLGTLASIQQAEGRLALAEVNMLAAENNIMDARANFERVVGHPAPEELVPVSDLDVPMSMTDAMERARQNQPTLALAQHDVAAANAQYDAARSLMYPRLHFEVERTWNEDIDGVEGTNEDLTAMLRMRYNIYNGGSDRARIRQTQHQITEAMEIRNSAERQVAQSLALSWNAYEILNRQMPHLEQHVVSSEQTRNSYKKQFDIGQRSLLDLLDTENEVFGAKNSLVDARYDELVARYRVMAGMGELLQSFEVPALERPVEEEQAAVEPEPQAPVEEGQAPVEPSADS